MPKSQLDAPAAPESLTLLNLDTLKARLGLSSATIGRMVSDGRLPKPFRTGKGQTCRRLWRRDEVEAAIGAWPREAA